jgi:hypothetical protein
MACLFCRKPVDGSRIEHILPESLGGGDWACLPDGLVCANCNQYFGSKVESKALGSYPFLPFRLLLGIPTKHKKAPFMTTTLCTLKSSHKPGHIGLDPFSNEVEQGILRNEVTQVRIIAEPTEPLAGCRLLLKMGLELLGCEDGKANLSRYDAARKFARSPQKNSRWWFLIACDFEGLFLRFKNGISLLEWQKGISLSIDDACGGDVFHLKLFEMSLIVPLDEQIEASQDIRESGPEWQVFDVLVSGQTGK